MNPTQQDWIKSTAEAAQEGGHIFPLMAACEAALESGYGQSALAREGNNLFGTKQHQHPVHRTLTLPTKEFLDGEWQVVDAAWVEYDDLAECFQDRMDTLTRMAPHYPHYAAALAATDPLTYVNEVSQSWSSDPARASKVIAVFNTYNAAQENSSWPNS